VTILGDDPVVARALELLLRSTGHDARFVADPADTRLDERLASLQLLLIAPEVSPQRAQALVCAADPARRTPVLELVPLSASARPRMVSQVSWPCGTERLVRAIDAALADSSPSDQSTARSADAPSAEEG
jgi:hypothetical protein